MIFMGILFKSVVLGIIAGVVWVLDIGEELD
jgi:hypothetical protein